MANYSNLKAAIAAAIKTNGNQEITGQVLQDVLTSVVSVIGANYTFAGVATPSTNPGTPDQNVVYMASRAGTYTNFGGIELPAGISLLMWNGMWEVQTFFTVDNLNVNSIIGKALIGDEEYHINGEDIPALVDSATGKNYAINLEQNKWNIVTGYAGSLIDIRIYRGHTICISRGDHDRRPSYTFLKSGVNVGQTPDYCEGFGVPINIDDIVYVTVPDDAVYVYIYLYSLDVNFYPEYVKMYGNVVEELEDMYDDTYGKPVYTLLASEMVSSGYAIRNADNVWIESNQYYGAVIPIGDYKGKTCAIFCNHLRNTNWGFLKSAPEANAVAEFAGNDIHSTVCSKDVTYLTIPDNAEYIYLYMASPNVVFTPLKFEIYDTGKEGYAYVAEKANQEVELLKKTAVRTPLKVVTWNIGHFAKGVNKDSDITPEQYETALADFRNLVYNQLNPDIIGLEEYSRVFSVGHDAKDVLFNDFCMQWEGVQRNYSCNAIYADIYIDNIQMHEFECLEDEVITHTTLIKATDYYYITADFYIKGRKIKLYVAHLAFDSNRRSVLQNMQIQELISVAANDERVMMMGDWNVHEFSSFDMFVNAGYTLANDGTIYTYSATNPTRAIDNIIVKGLNVSDVGVVQSELSDHLAFYATINI